MTSYVILECGQYSETSIYPLVLLMFSDEYHLISEVAEIVLQSLHAVFGLCRVVIDWVLAHLNVQM